MAVRTRGEAIGQGLVATGAVSVAIAAIVAIVVRTVEVFAHEVSVRMPITGGDVDALQGVDGIAGAEYASADVVLTALPTGIRWLFLLEGALPALATVGVCAAAWWLGVSLLRGRPFRRSMSTALGVAACLIAAGGLFGQVLGSIARAATVEMLGAADATIYDTFYTFLIELDLSPLGWAFALALVAGAFEVGTRLQRETEGLV